MNLLILKLMTAKGMIKIIIINVLLFITFKSVLTYAMPALSVLYMWHNIRKQIIDFYDGDWKEYLKSTIKPLKKSKNLEEIENIKETEKSE